jgi:aspartate/methionine/tyrosine aminotransferase
MPAAAHEAMLSARAGGLAMSAIKEMAMRSARVPGAASLAWGLPSFPTPAPMRRAVARALEEDPAIGMYALPNGLPEFRAAIAEAHARDTGRFPDPETEIMVTAGNMEGIATALHVLVDPGDEVVLTDPCFASHIQQVRMVGGAPVHWPLEERLGWQPDPDALARLIGPRTKAILLVSPVNPTGTILSEEVLRAAALLAERHGIMVLVDDPYRHFLYENRPRFFNLGGAAEHAAHTAYFFTFSKAYAMSGWRMGYMAAPDWFTREMVKMHDLTMICAPRVAQVAARAGLEDGGHLAEFEAVLARRREAICARLDRVAHVFSYVRPEGAYYVFPRILVPHGTDRDFAYRLLEEAKVTVTPGSAFGPQGAGHVRMAFCVADEVIETAFDRIEAHFGA